MPPGFEQKLRQQLTYWAGTLPEEPLAGSHRRNVWLLRGSAVAAALILAISTVWWIVGGGVGRATADFARMLENIKDARWAAYDLVVRPQGEPEIRARVLMAKPGRTRVTWPDGKVHIMDGAEGKLLRLSPNTMSGRVVPLPTGRDDALDRLKNVDKAAGKFEGTRKINSQLVKVYSVASLQDSMEILVDAETELPVRIETESVLDDGERVTTVLENFTWNEPIPDSMFSLELPQDYALETIPSEKSLVETLRICTSRRDGSFPSKLDFRTVISLAVNGNEQSALETGAEGVPRVGRESAQKRDATRTCQDGLTFIEQVSRNGSWRYAGEGARLGDGSRAICWWQPEGSPTYRVVYGDLQIKDVPPQDVPSD